jgi:hypothetical protein
MLRHRHGCGVGRLPACFAAPDRSALTLACERSGVTDAALELSQPEWPLNAHQHPMNGGPRMSAVPISIHRKATYLTAGVAVLVILCTSSLGYLFMVTSAQEPPPTKPANVISDAYLSGLESGRQAAADNFCSTPEVAQRGNAAWQRLTAIHGPAGSFTSFEAQGNHNPFFGISCVYSYRVTFAHSSVNVRVVMVPTRAHEWRVSDLITP